MSEVLTAMTVKITIFCSVTPYSLEEVYSCFRGTAIPMMDELDLFTLMTEVACSSEISAPTQQKHGVRSQWTETYNIS
jgi:hypothetical protein